MSLSALSICVRAQIHLDYSVVVVVDSVVVVVVVLLRSVVIVDVVFIVSIIDDVDSNVVVE